MKTAALPGYIHFFGPVNLLPPCLEATVTKTTRRVYCQALGYYQDWLAHDRLFSRIQLTFFPMHVQDADGLEI